MTDILNLPDWKAIATRQDGSEYVIEADYTIQPKACQKCGYRCQSCGGIYDQEDLYATRIGVMFSDQPLTNLTLMCRHCKVRFHTEGATHVDSTSTS